MKQYCRPHSQLKGESFFSCSSVLKRLPLNLFKKFNFTSSVAHWLPFVWNGIVGPLDAHFIMTIQNCDPSGKNSLLKAVL